MPPARSQIDAQADSDKKLLIRGILEGRVPKASARTILWGEELFSKCPNSCLSMSDLAMMLSNALRKSGYYQQGWYLISDSAAGNSTKLIAVTQLEQISDSGKPKVGRDRWKDQFSQPLVRSFSDFMTTLLRGAPPGRYRAFLFGFSDEPISNTYLPFRGEDKISGLRNAIRSGARMPVFQSLRTIPTRGIHCYVFVYEYIVSSVDGSIMLVANSELTAEQHLRASGIWKELGGK